MLSMFKCCFGLLEIVTKNRCISQDKKSVFEFLELPRISHRAAKFYKIFNSLQKDICKNLRIIRQRDLESQISNEEWLKILSSAGK